MDDPIVIIIIICVIIYITFVILMLFKGNPSINENITKITAPTPDEIQKEKKLLSDSFSYPDVLFEKMVALIINDNPKPREVIKLIEKYFSKEDERMLLHCLSINNPSLHNEVLSLIHCNTDSFEEYESTEYDIDIDDSSENDSEKGQDFQTGIPDSFFILASKTIKNPNQDTYAAISIAYESLDPEKQQEILRQCEGIKRKKKIPKEDDRGDIDNDFSQIIDEGKNAAALFLERFEGKDI